VLPDPEFYEPFMKEMEQGDGSVSLKFRKEAAAFTFNMTSTYDGMIAEYLNTNDA
jgi:phosphoribosylaminoimidazolecarboxamide formyltransferase/IMP cyclohydrolase